MTVILRRFICVLLAATLLLLSGCSTAMKKSGSEDIVAVSFYPVYIFTLNLTDGIEGLSVECMAEQSVGCLHDYTITARDAKLLSDADLLVINGSGMESFMEDLNEKVDEITVIDSSMGIETLCAEGGHSSEEDEHHTHGSHNHNHTENSHIWMSVNNAKKQVVNIADGLCDKFPGYKKIIRENCEGYLKRLETLEKDIEKVKEQVQGEDVVVFHNGYEYLTTDLGLHIVASVESDEGAEPSAKELVRLTEKINECGVKALFVDPSYEGSGAEILSNETNAGVYVLSPFVSGEVSKTAYEDTIRENIKTILRAVN